MSKTRTRSENPLRGPPTWALNSSQRRTTILDQASIQWEPLLRKLQHPLVRQSAKTSGRSKQREMHQVPENTKKTHLALVKQREVPSTWALNSSPS